MRDSFAIHVVDCFNEHLEQASANLWFKPSFFGNVLKQFSTFSEFQHDDGSSCLWFAQKTNFRINFVTYYIDKVFKVKCW